MNVPAAEQLLGNPHESIPAAAYKTLIDRLEIEGSKVRLPDYGSFKEYLAPIIEYELASALLKEHNNSQADLAWRMMRHHELQRRKMNAEAQLKR
jgi:hypothetical protein